MKKEREEKILIIKVLLLLVVSIALYFNTLQNKFALDDTMMITQNEFTKGGVEGLKKIFTTDSFTGFLGEGKTLLPGGRYRPLSIALFNIYYSLFGLKPFGLHLINILLFALSVLLLFKVLRTVFPDQSSPKDFFTLPFIASLLYAVHPLNTEVVANIKSMDLLLSMIFSFSTLYYLIKYVTTKKPAYLFLTAPLFFLGILAKESTLTFFAVIPLILWLFFKPSKKQFALSLLPLIITLAAYFALRWAVLGNNLNVRVHELLNDPFLGATLLQKYATVFYTWLIYLKLMIFPHPLTHDYYPYVIEIQNPGNPLVILSFLFFSTFTVLSVRHLIRVAQKKTEPDIYLFGFMFFMLVFSITSNLIINIGTFMNERFVYPAHIGFFIIAAKAFTDFRKKTKLKNAVALAVLLAVLVPLSLKTVGRNRVWKDDYTLFRTDVKVSHNSAKCNVSAGGKTYEKALEMKNKKSRRALLFQAKAWITKGLKIHPKYFQAWELLGNVNYELADYDNSLLCYSNCLKLAPKDKNVMSNMRNLAIKAAEVRNWKVSDSALSILLHKKYRIVNITFLKAYNYERENRIDSAIRLLNKVLSMDSTYADAYNKLGQIYGKNKGDMALAEHYLMKAYELAPTNYSVLENLGTLYAIRGEVNKALYFFKESYKANPDNKQIYSNIAIAYRQLGKPEEAALWENKLKKKK